MARTLFGTDGIRGPANTWPMTAEVAMACGRALAALVRDGRLGRQGFAAQAGSTATLLPTGTAHQGRIVIGKDTRLSGYMLEQAIAAGITSMGVDVMLTGPLPTPGIAFITNSMRADAGVVVSASHNPFEDNGIKIFGHDGFKLPDAVEEELEGLIHTFLDPHADRPRPLGRGIGRAWRIEDARGRYIVHLKATFPAELSLEGLRLVVDSANGAAWRVAPHVFRELGCEVIELGTAPDGTNINAGCGSLHPEAMQQAVLAHGAHMGIALDGDADRVIICDEQGRLVDGDAVMAVCAGEMKQRGVLRGDAIVATVMSNVGLERALLPAGVRVERAPVGDRYVVERMREQGLNLGGEQSGHLVFLDHATTGDGCVAALAVLASMLRARRPLSEVAAVFQPSPQHLKNIRVAKKIPLEELAGVRQTIAAVEAALGAGGRVLVRYSGTEMKCRVMVEGDDQDTIVAAADRIATALLDALGATP